MLRTCSLPDLSRVFSCVQDPAGPGEEAAPLPPLEIDDLEEEGAVKDEDNSETEE